MKNKFLQKTSALFDLKLKREKSLKSRKDIGVQVPERASGRIAGSRGNYHEGWNLNPIDRKD